MSSNRKWDPSKDANVIDGCISNDVVFTPVVRIRRTKIKFFMYGGKEYTCIAFPGIGVGYKKDGNKLGKRKRTKLIEDLNALSEFREKQTDKNLDLIKDRRFKYYTSESPYGINDDGSSKTYEERDFLSKFELNEMVVVGLNKIYDTRFRQDYLGETCDSFLKMLEIGDDRLKNESWIKQFNCKESDTWPIDRNLLSWIDAALSVRHSIACHGCPDIVTDAVYIDRIKEALPGLKTELIVSIIETFQVWYLSTAYEKKWLKKK